jgi:hypothetical protein
MNPQYRLSLRLTADEAEKWLNVKSSIEARIGPIPDASILRELIGFDPPKKLQQEEREYLAGLRNALSGIEERAQAITKIQKRGHGP